MSPTFRAPFRFLRVAGGGLVAFLSLVCVSAHEWTLPHLLIAQAPPPAAPTNIGPLAPLTLELTMAGTTEVVAGLVRITSVGSGKPVDLPAHLRRPMGWFSLPPHATVNVPVGRIRIEACHGLETEMALATHEVIEEKTNRVQLTLRRLYNPANQRLVGANTHLHLRLNSAAGMGGAALRTRREAEEYLTAIGQSDGLDLVYVSHLVRASEDASYVSNQFTRENLAQLSNARVRFVNGEEHRHEGGRSPSRGGPDELRYGHVLFLDLPRLVEPVSYGTIFTPGAAPGDAVPMRRAISGAHAQHATVIWCHGKQGTEDVPNWIDGLLHAQNIFDGGSEGTVDAVFYPYLNAGLRVPFSTGTDWGCYDFSRVYVPLARPASSDAFRQALAQGHSFITNGPFLELEADGLTSGAVLDLPKGRAVKIHARGIGRDDFVRIEVVFNGTIVGKATARRVEGHFRAELDALIEVREPGWLALRISSDRPYTDRAQYTGAGANLFGKALFAHTSPVYVNIAGRSVRQPAAIRMLIAEIEASIRTIEAKGAFASDAERDALLVIYRNAIGTLERRLIP